MSGQDTEACSREHPGSVRWGTQAQSPRRGLGMHHRRRTTPAVRRPTGEMHTLHRHRPGTSLSSSCFPPAQPPQMRRARPGRTTAVMWPHGVSASVQGSIKCITAPLPPNASMLALGKQTMALAGKDACLIARPDSQRTSPRGGLQEQPIGSISNTADKTVPAGKPVYRLTHRPQMTLRLPSILQSNASLSRLPCLTSMSMPRAAQMAAPPLLGVTTVFRH
jgi:hypothetical protein